MLLLEESEGMVAVLHRDPEDARDKKTEDLRKAVRLDELADVRGVGRLGLSEVVEFLLDLGQAFGLRGFCATGFELDGDLAEVGELGFLRLDLLAARGGERLGVAASLPLGLELRPGLGQRLGARVDPVVKLSAEVGELGVERIAGLLRLGRARLGGLTLFDGLVVGFVPAQQSLHQLVGRRSHHLHLLLGVGAGLRVELEFGLHRVQRLFGGFERGCGGRELLRGGLERAPIVISTGQGGLGFDPPPRLLFEARREPLNVLRGCGRLDRGAGLVDELHLTVCPKVFGGRTAPTIADGCGALRLTDAADFTLKSARRVADEIFLVYSRTRRTG